MIVSSLSAHFNILLCCLVRRRRRRRVQSHYRHFQKQEERKTRFVSRFFLRVISLVVSSKRGRDVGVHHPPLKKRSQVMMMIVVVVVFFSRFCRRKRRSIAEDPARVFYRKASSFTSVFPRAILLVGVFALPILKIHLHPRLLEHHAARRSTRDPQKNTTTKEEDRAPCSTSSFPSSRLGRTGSGRSLCS